MGTSNFFWQNAKHCYVIDAKDYYDKDGEPIDEYEDGCTEIDRTSDEIEYIQDLLIEDGWDRENEFIRDWDSTIIASRGEYKEIAKGLDLLWINREIIVRYGYYEAANLDWDVTMHNNWEFRRSNYETIEDMAEDVADDLLSNSDWNEGLRKANRAMVVKRIAFILEGVCEECDNVCADMSTDAYRVAYTCSNGETGYVKVS